MLFWQGFQRVQAAFGVAVRVEIGLVAQGFVKKLAGVGIATGVQGFGGDQCRHFGLHQVIDKAMRQIDTRGAAGDHQVVDKQDRTFIRHKKAHGLPGIRGCQGITDPGHGHTQLALVEIFDVALAVDVAQVRSQTIQNTAGTFDTARCAARQAAALIIEQQGQGLVRSVQHADAATGEARALLCIK